MPPNAEILLGGILVELTVILVFLRVLIMQRQPKIREERWRVKYPVVTKSNLTQWQDVRDVLVEWRESLGGMLQNYPVECTFGGYRFVFSTLEDLDNLTKSLQAGIASVQNPIHFED